MVSSNESKFNLIMYKISSDVFKGNNMYMIMKPFVIVSRFSVTTDRVNTKISSTLTVTISKTDPVSSQVRRKNKHHTDHY